ncbi:PepSY domain-containing protein [Deferribacterales bacterium Es71-Z0220]|uniref:PepSY domain-containing protein n=1 Tax=Deferrivibrio essentukiensis TaxID=2880922 RepID=UPI001F61BE4D|nr:PepSY domain-containing protein [Deferrivibrio essentukiensis]MCB4205197.1 PepSY domain-containing protein [Deferrivibrio essentukiensis]
MKKLILISGAIMISAALAFAHGGYGRGYAGGQSYGMMGGQGYGYGPGGCPGQFQNGNAKQLTEEEAVKSVQEIISKNFKGYEIVKTEKFNMPMGTMYEVEVKDAAGNEFDFHVNPWGNVMGPFVDNKGDVK